MEKTLDKKRINEMIKVIMKIVKGNYSKQIKLYDKKDELDYLAKGINMMIDNIKKSDEETKVRTSELMKTNKQLQKEINERKQVEESFRKSEERFRSLVNSMHDFVFTLDLQQQPIGTYGKLVEKYGIIPENYIGKTGIDIMSTQGDEIHKKANERALKGEHVVYECFAIMIV